MRVRANEEKGEGGEVRAEIRRESSESKSQSSDKRERKKTNKILNVCTVTVTTVHKCTILHPLMWVFFCSNCVKLAHFFIVHNYASTDVIALTI